MHHFQSKLADQKELIEQRAFHPYLARYIQGPLLDEDMLLLLLSMFDQLDLTDIETDTYITAIILIQLALDTHDHVASHSIEADLKRQQLTVLAGDYYSGLYYKYLSGINNIMLIRELSEGIKEINEHKIMVYEHSHDQEIGQVVASLKKIEGALIEKIANYFKEEIWTEFALNFLLVKRLLQEKEQIFANGTSVGFEAIKRAVFPDYDKNELQLNHEQHKHLLGLVDHTINDAIHLMETEKEKLPHINELLSIRIQEILNQHHTMAKTFAEEG